MPQRFAKVAVGGVDAALPTRLNLFRAGERAAVEIEIFVHEFAGKRGSRGTDQVPAQVNLPVRNGHGFQFLIEGLEKFRLANVHDANIREANLAEVIRRERTQPRRIHFVIIGFRVAALHARLGGLRHLRLDGQHGARFGGSFVGGVAGQF